MNTIFAVDDGLTNGNFNAADIVLLIAAALAVLGAIFAYASTAPPTPPIARWATPFAYLAIGVTAFALFLW